DDDGKASSSSSKYYFRYGVFLSFRGEDTRDEGGLVVGGGDLTTGLVQGIKSSRILMVVFSRSYASSTWCLNELETIMQCRTCGRQTVVPVFYGVAPSDVRHQRGSFADALAQLSNSEKHKEKVAKWREALTQASSISGFELSTAHQYEAEFVKKIVKWVVGELSYTNLFITDYPVGMDSRVKEIRSFLENVREVSQQHKGLQQLQEQFLSDMFRTMEVKIHRVARGKKLIEERHCGKKVLLVLDDVDEVDQFNSIVRSRDWFGIGSRIIITTRNEDFLQQFGVDEVCITPELNDTEDLELFSWHAFGRSDPEHDFLEWSKEIVRYCQGLPLALEVLGGVLIGQKKHQWKHQLDKLLGSLPGDYGKLKSLKTLVLDFCSKLHTYPENMSSLNGNLRFLGRESLKKGSLLLRSSKGFSLLPFLNLSSSFVSHDHPSIEKWHQLIHKAQRSDLSSSSSSGLPLMPPEHVLTHDFLQDGKVQQVIQELCSHAWGGKFVHGDHMPDKYIYCHEGSSVGVDVPDEIDGLYGLKVCCVYS
ncbi:hypothetical protein Tsubulata_025188, partial [Turnera subulata]